MSQVIVDEVMLREPNLLIPGKKPIGPVKIDWNNPLAPKVECILFSLSADKFLDLINGTPAEITGTNREFGVGVNGKHNYYSAASINNWIQIAPAITGISSFTHEWIATYPATMTILTDGFVTAHMYLFDIQTDRFVIGHPSGSTSIQFYDGAWSDTSYTPCGNGHQHCIFSFNGTSGNASLYVNGVQQYSASTYTARTITSSTARLLNRYSSTSSYYNHTYFQLYYYGIHDRALTDGEAFERYRDPYQFLIPA